jgi:uncharacterized coiled-coil protein SlyX
MVPAMITPHTTAMMMMVRRMAALEAAATASAQACRTVLSAVVARQQVRAAQLQAHLLWVRVVEGDGVSDGDRVLDTPHAQFAQVYSRLSTAAAHCRQAGEALGMTVGFFLLSTVRGEF